MVAAIESRMATVATFDGRRCHQQWQWYSLEVVLSSLCDLEVVRSTFNVESCWLFIGLKLRMGRGAGGERLGQGGGL